MTWYELLLSLHILSAAMWFGSSLAITVIAYRLVAVGGDGLRAFVTHAGWWAGRAHPAAGVALIVTAGLMIADASLELTELWILLAFAGWLVAGGIGGNVIGPTAQRLGDELTAGDGVLTDSTRGLADRLLLATRIELAVLTLVVFVMVVKPG